MFNVKVSLLYFLLIFLSVISLVKFAQVAEEDAIAQAERSLQMFPRMFDSQKELRERRLEGFARRVASSEIHSSLRAITEWRERFLEIDRFICSPKTGVKCDQANHLFSESRKQIAQDEYGRRASFVADGQCAEEAVRPTATCEEASDDVCCAREGGNTRVARAECEADKVQPLDNCRDEGGEVCCLGETGSSRVAAGECSAERVQPEEACGPRDEQVCCESDDRYYRAFTDTLVRYVRAFHRTWSDEETSSFRSNVRSKLEECFGRGSAQCDWRFAYDALRRVLPEISEGTRRVGVEQQTHDLVLVFDHEGVGLANANDEAWSFRTCWEASLDEPCFVDVIGKLRSSVVNGSTDLDELVYFDLFKFMETGDTEYFAAVVPVLGTLEASAQMRSRLCNETTGLCFLGAVLVGDSLTQKLVDQEKNIFGHEVTYILEDKPLASTMEPTQYQFLLTGVKVRERLKPSLASNHEWIAFSVPYYDSPVRAPEGAGDAVPTFVDSMGYGAKYQELRVVVTTPRERWVGAFEAVQYYIPLFGLLLFMVGVILFWLLIQNHTRPFEAIDQGIHEVINGNFDYVFPFDYPEELPSAMAQSLNLMNAVLLGKPLPEDEEAGGSWDVSSGRSMERRSSGGPALVVANQPDDDPMNPELLREPAETYYRRLYAEYRQSGAEGLTYVRFVEQMARHERALKETLGCKHLRFKVKTGEDGAAILVPVPLV